MTQLATAAPRPVLISHWLAASQSAGRLPTSQLTGWQPVSWLGGIQSPGGTKRYCHFLQNQRNQNLRVESTRAKHHGAYSTSNFVFFLVPASVSCYFYLVFFCFLCFFGPCQCFVLAAAAGLVLAAAAGLVLAAAAAAAATAAAGLALAGWQN